MVLRLRWWCYGAGLWVPDLLLMRLKLLIFLKDNIIFRVLATEMIQK